MSVDLIETALKQGPYAISAMMSIWEMFSTAQR